MMKKTCLISLLCLALFTQGCIPYITTDCGPYSGPPGAPYFVRYPDGMTGGGSVKPNGLFTVKPRGFDCGQIMVLVGTSFGLSLGAAPASVYLPSPPTSGTITGQSFDATYGAPRLDYYDGNGYLVDSVYATWVSGDGTQLQANFPNLSQVYSGTYQVKVTNKRSDGYYLNMVGSATISGWGRDRPDSDGDGWYDDEDCDPYNPQQTDNCIEICGGGQEPIYICP